MQYATLIIMALFTTVSDGALGTIIGTGTTFGGAGPGMLKKGGPKGAPKGGPPNGGGPKGGGGKPPRRGSKGPGILKKGGPKGESNKPIFQRVAE